MRHSLQHVTVPPKRDMEEAHNLLQRWRASGGEGIGIAEMYDVASVNGPKRVLVDMKRSLVSASPRG